MRRHLSARLGIASVLCLLALAASCKDDGPPDSNGTPAQPSSTAINGTALPPAVQTQIASITPEPAAYVTPKASDCAPPPDDTFVLFTLNTEGPSPACGQVRPDQSLQFLNGTDGEIQVRIGLYDFPVTPGDTAEYGALVSWYLDPGVHIVHTSLYDAPEILVLPD